jgi:hypothetical protein
MDDEIPEDDYKMFPCGHLGGKTGVSQSGKFLGEFTETEEAMMFVSDRMEQEQYWPSIWWISDHGNAWMIDFEGNEIPMTTCEGDEDQW